MMTKSELMTALLSVVDNVIDDHITTDDTLQLPYVVLVEMGSDNLFADNLTYQESVPYNVILHQAKKDNGLIAEIKEMLTDNCIPYNFSTEWDEDYLLWATTFEVMLWEDSLSM